MAGRKTQPNADSTKTITTPMLKLLGRSGITIMRLDTLPKTLTMDKLDSISWKMIRRTLFVYHLATTTSLLLLQPSDTTLMARSGTLRLMERLQVSSVTLFKLMDNLGHTLQSNLANICSAFLTHLSAVRSNFTPRQTRRLALTFHSQ